MVRRGGFDTTGRGGRAEDRKVAAAADTHVAFFYSVSLLCHSHRLFLAAFDSYYRPFRKSMVAVPSCLGRRGWATESIAPRDCGEEGTIRNAGRKMRRGQGLSDGAPVAKEHLHICRLQEHPAHSRTSSRMCQPEFTSLATSRRLQPVPYLYPSLENYSQL